MKYITSFIWPLLIIVGASLFYITSGTDDPLFNNIVWLVPIGVVGSVVEGYKQRRRILATLIMASWILVVVSILGLYNSWFTTGLDALGWIVPILGFAAIGCILVVAGSILNVLRLNRESSTTASQISAGTPRQ